MEHRELCQYEHSLSLFDATKLKARGLPFPSPICIRLCGTNLTLVLLTFLCTSNLSPLTVIYGSPKLLWTPLGIGRVCPDYVCVLCEAHSPNYHLGSRSTVGGSEEEIRKWNKAARRRESGPQCETPEFSAWGKSSVNAVLGRGGSGSWEFLVNWDARCLRKPPDLLGSSILRSNKRTLGWWESCLGGTGLAASNREADYRGLTKRHLVSHITEGGRCCFVATGYQAWWIYKSLALSLTLAWLSFLWTLDTFAIMGSWSEKNLKIIFYDHIGVKMNIASLCFFP